MADYRKAGTGRERTDGVKRIKSERGAGIRGKQ